VQSGEPKAGDEAARVLVGGKFAFTKGSSHQQTVGKFLITARAEDDIIVLRIFEVEVKDKADNLFFEDSTTVPFFRTPVSISTVDI
jgi:hypothetical protein